MMKMQASRMVRFLSVAAMAAMLTCAVRCVRAGSAPSAEQILKNMENATKNAKSYQMKMNVSVKMTMSGGSAAGAPGGGNMNMTMTLSMAMVKPNKIRVESKNSQMPGANMTIVSNGKTLWTYNGMLNQYTEKPAPADLTKMNFSQTGGFINPTQDLTKNLKSAKLVGSEKVGKVDAYVIEAVVALPQMGPMGGGQGLPFKMWIGKQDHMLYKFSANMTNTMPIPQPPSQGGAPSQPQTMTMKLSFAGTVSDVKLNTPIPEAVFTFKPPAGAKKVEQFQMPGMGGMPGGPGGPGGPSAPGRK
jgi:outer membrane lipoprotein-sorting protein